MSELTAPSAEGRPPSQGKHTISLSILNGIRTFTTATDTFYKWSAYSCGVLLLLLSLFITYEVIARKLGIIKAPAIDQFSGFVMVFAITWGFSYALRTGAHVRIDILLPFMPPPVRFVADWLALASISFFASITSWKAWILVLGSYEFNSHTLVYPRVQLFIPQSVLAIGVSLLAFTTVHMLISMLAERFLPVLHRMMGGSEEALAPSPDAASAIEQKEVL